MIRATCTLARKNEDVDHMTRAAAADDRRTALVAILGSVVETSLLLGCGAVPAALMLIAAFVLIYADPGFWDDLWFGAASLGTAGLWISVFYRPDRATAYGLFVVVLLLFGLVAVAPFAGALILGLLKDPSAMVIDAWNWVLVAWILLGPVACALHTIVSHVVLRRKG